MIWRELHVKYPGIPYQSIALQNHGKFTEPLITAMSPGPHGATPFFSFDILFRLTIRANVDLSSTYQTRWNDRWIPLTKGQWYGKLFPCHDSIMDITMTSLWARGVSNHQPHDCLHNRLFRRRSKKISKLCVTGLCAGNSPVTGEFPAQRPVTRK